MPDPINTTTMPGDNMSPDQIDASAGKMRTIGTKVSTQGGTVLTSWQKISAHYDAPEENTLFHAMNPVKADAEKFGTDVGSAATALETFADEVRKIKTAVASIRADAADFKADIANGVEKTTVTARGMSTKTETIEWHEDAASVNRNNELIQRTNDQQEALWAAERTCASTIRGLVGLGPITAASESNPNGYGLDEIPDSMPTDWGSKVEKTENCGESVVHGVANGIGAMGEGFAAMVGFKYTGTGLWNSWDWSWEHDWGNAGETWTGIGKFLLGAATLGPPGTAYAFLGNGPGSDLLKESQMTFAAGVAGLVAIDAYNADPFHKWKKSPGQAIGETGFNIATFFVAPAKIGNVGKAGAVGKIGEVGATVLKITDPLYWTSKAGQAIKAALGPSVESLLRLNKAADFDTGLTITKEIDLPTVERAGTDTPNNTGGPGNDAPPPRDYTEPTSRHDSGNDTGTGNDTRSGSDQSPTPDRQPTPDREPALVGGRDTDTSPTNRGAGDDSGPIGGGRDTDPTPTNRGGDDTPGTNPRGGDDTPTTADRGGDGDTPTTDRAGDDTPSSTHRDGDGNSSPDPDGSSGSDRSSEGNGSEPTPVRDTEPDTQADGNHHAGDATGDSPASASNDRTPMHVPDEYQHLDRHDLDSGGTGDWTKELHKPEPNSVYVVDDRHLFVTDDHGRVTHVESTLDTLPSDRNTYQQGVAGREYRLEIDQGGHLVATRFGGPGEGINLVPMAKELNGAGKNNWWAMEKEWGDTLRANPHAEIKVKIDLKYPDASTRPERFLVESRVGNSEPITWRFRQ